MPGIDSMFRTVGALIMISAIIAGGFAMATDDARADMAPPPDCEAVIRSEYRMLADRGTVEAMELFIRRHPDHPLAEAARKRLEALKNE